jgi:glutamine amidotransferase
VIAVIDYGAGNITSVVKALRRAGATTSVTSTAEGLENALGILIPGVGHFSATTAIDATLRDAILSRAAAGTPILGICLGMQWLTDGSTEAPNVPGLGLIRGRCSRLSSTPRVKVPHVGWNSVAPVADSRLLAGIPPAAFAYFSHTFAAPITSATVATAEHGTTFSAVFERQNIFGAQFHPELSAETGARLLGNFVEIASC